MFANKANNPQKKKNIKKKKKKSYKRCRRPETYKVTLPLGSAKYVFGRGGKNVQRIEHKLTLLSKGITKVHLKMKRNKDSECFWCQTEHNGKANPDWRDTLTLLLHSEIADYTKKALEKEAVSKSQKETAKEFSHRTKTSGKKGTKKKSGTEFLMKDLMLQPNTITTTQTKSKKTNRGSGRGSGSGSVNKKVTSFDFSKSSGDFPALINVINNVIKTEFNVEAASFVPVSKFSNELNFSDSKPELPLVNRLVFVPVMIPCHDPTY